MQMNPEIMTMEHMDQILLQAHEVSSQLQPEITHDISDDPRLHVFRKLSKTLKPAVLLKSWQRLCMLIAGIETSRDCPQASVATLEKEIYDRYHGNLHRDPPLIGTVKRAMDDQLDCIAGDKFGVKFPKDKISYVQMTAGMPGHTIWRYYKELVADVANKINLVYRSCLNEDFSFPDGKNLYDVLEETLKILWSQNEEVRKDRINKRLDDGETPRGDDSDSEKEQQESMPMSMDGQYAGRKRSSNSALLAQKPFPGVGKFQPIAFLAFLLLGPPAGEKCWNRFALDAHLEAPPPRPRISMGGRSSIGDADGSFDEFISPRSERKRQKVKGDANSEEENEAIRIFNAETSARAQRLEELKLALSLFPDDENIKAELKQFVDTQRRTSLSNDGVTSLVSNL